MNTSERIAYLDCFSGISGDMLLGSLINAGLSVELLEQALTGLKLKPFDFTVSEKKIQSISAVTVQITPREKQRIRNLTDITNILDHSSLDPVIIERSLAVFTRLAEAEATVHGKPIEQIHFHEVGALDTIIDVVGVISGFNLLGISEIHCSPLPIGRGFVRCAHGNLPLPAPAVCTLLTGLPVYGIDADKELVTPTGAAIVAELANTFGNLPPMTIEATGYGAGQNEGTEDRPNMLRLIIGTGETVTEVQQVLVIETNLDDWNPETFPFLCSRLLDNHALDVSLVPLQMKKGRPGFRLQVLCHQQHGRTLKEIILTETTAIGLRFRTEQRETLPREQVEIDTPWGIVSAKKVQTPRGSRIYPEYESCRQTAEKHGLPIDDVYRQILTKTR